MPKYFAQIKPSLKAKSNEWDLILAENYAEAARTLREKVEARFAGKWQHEGAHIYKERGESVPESVISKHRYAPADGIVTDGNDLLGLIWIKYTPDELALMRIFSRVMEAIEHAEQMTRDLKASVQEMVQANPWLGKEK